MSEVFSMNSATVSEDVVLCEGSKTVDPVTSNLAPSNESNTVKLDEPKLKASTSLIK